MKILGYGTLEEAKEAHQQGLISDEEMEMISEAFYEFGLENQGEA